MQLLSFSFRAILASFVCNCQLQWNERPTTSCQRTFWNKYTLPNSIAHAHMPI